MSESPPAQSDRQYMYVAPGERGAVSLIAPSGESVVLVMGMVSGRAQVMVATPEGQPIESAGWKLAALQSSFEQRERR